MKWRITSISLTSWCLPDGIAREFGAERFRGVNGWDVERRKFHPALAGRGLLEDQGFVLDDVRACLADVPDGRL